MSSSPTAQTEWPLSKEDDLLMQNLYLFPSCVRLVFDLRYNTFSTAFVYRAAGGDDGACKCNCRNSRTCQKVEFNAELVGDRAFQGLMKAYEKDWNSMVQSTALEPEEEGGEGGESDSDDEAEGLHPSSALQKRLFSVDNTLWCDGDFVASNHFTALALSTSSSEHVLTVGSPKRNLLVHEFTDEEEEEMRGLRFVPAMTSPAVLRMIVAGEVTDVQSVLSAEGQLARLLHQSSSAMEMLAYLEVWLCIICQLTETSFIQDCIDLASMLSEKAVVEQSAEDSTATRASRCVSRQEFLGHKEIMMLFVAEARLFIEDYCYEIRAEHEVGMRSE